MTSPALRLGTRGSPLALAQAEEVRLRLIAADPQLAAAGAVTIIIIRTTGDAVLDRTLAEVGGKGLFTKEIDEAMLAGDIDLAVHSAKDLPTALPPGIDIGALLPRGDPRDAFVAAAVHSIDALPRAARVGTASLRRRAQLLARRPDLRVEPLRGNVGTRLAKVADGQFAATVLAVAGLSRLGLRDRATAVLAAEEMLPAVAQAAIAVTARSGDGRCRAWLAALNDGSTAVEVATERALLAALDGSCRTPIAGLARHDPARGTVALRALIARPDGTALLATERIGAAADGARLGRDAGDELRRRAGPGFFG